MVHIPLGGLSLIQSVQPLCLRQRRQSSNGTDLGLSTGKHSRTVNSGDQVYFRRQWTDLIDGSAVRTLVILQDHLAHRLLLILVNRLAQHFQPLFLLREGLSQLLCDLADILFSYLLLIGKYRFLHLCGRNDLPDRLKQLLRNRAALIFMFRLAALCHDGIDERDHLLVQLVGCEDGVDHLLLRHFLCARLDHDHLFSGGSNCQRKCGYLSLGRRRVEHQLSVYQAYLGGRDGAVKRNVRDGGSDSRAQHSGKLRRAVLVYRQHQVLQGNVIAVILGEQRPHGTVDDTAGQDGVLRRFSLSFVESSRDLAYRVQTLVVLHA